MTGSESSSPSRLLELLELVREFPLSGLSRDEFLARHAQHRDQLADMLPEDGDDFTPVRRFGAFELVRELGRGGMGVVFEALEVAVDRRCALKVLHHGGASDDRTVARFRREARFCANLRHPGIVRLVTFGQERGEHFLVMELVEGVALSRVLEDLRAPSTAPLTAARFWDALDRQLDRAGFLPNAEAKAARSRAPFVRLMVDLVARVADALECAHRAGVVHRDVKPANILVRGDGGPVLSDFGVAREEGELGMTQTGEPAGTLHYRAPEQWDSAPNALDGRADQFALAVTAYEVLTLRRPFEGETVDAVRLETCQARPVDVRRRNREVDRDLAAILDRALEKDRRDRFASTRGLVEDLQRWLAGQPVHARPMPAWKRTWRWVGRNRTAAAVLAALAVLSAGLIVTAWELLRTNTELDTANLLLAIGSFPQTVAQLPMPEPEHRQLYANILRYGEGVVTRESAARRRSLAARNATDVPAQSSAVTGPEFPILELEHLRQRLQFIDAPLPDWDAVSAALKLPAVAAKYGGLRPAPQRGMQFLGVNPNTDLLEFWFPASGKQPERGSKGWAIGPETSIVFVLLPGGDFGGKVVRPFFSAAHELTQGQWARLDVEDAARPSEFDAQNLRLQNSPLQTHVADQNHPVESVTADAAARLLRRWGLDLPTSLQWSYFADLERLTPIREEDPARIGNFSDMSASSFGLAAAEHYDGINRVEDGFALHAPVGSYEPNSFGVYDVLGNVWELCVDPSAPRDKVFLAGRSFLSRPMVGPDKVEESHVLLSKPGTSNPDIGVRVVREIR